MIQWDTAPHLTQRAALGATTHITLTCKFLPSRPFCREWSRVVDLGFCCCRVVWH